MVREDESAGGQMITKMGRQSEICGIVAFGRGLRIAATMTSRASRVSLLASGRWCGTAPTNTALRNSCYAFIFFQLFKRFESKMG